MKFSFSRTISPKRFFPDLNYESAEFTVEDCETKEQAMLEVEEWIEDWVAEGRKKATIVKIEKKEAEAAEKYSKTDDRSYIDNDLPF